MTHCSLLKCSGLLPAYLTLPFYLWFLFLWLFKLPIASPIPPIWPLLLWTTHLDKDPLEGSFSLAVGSLEASSCYVQHFGKQGQVQGNWRPNYDRALGAAAGPAVQRFSTGPLPPKLNYSAQPSLVQHSCWSNIFSLARHYFRNECSCVFIANRVPALSTIKEIRIQQTYSSN